MKISIYLYTNPLTICGSEGIFIGEGAISVISALTGGLVGAGVGGFLGSIAESNIDTSKGIYN